MTPTIISDNSITVVLDGVPYACKKGDENFEKVLAAVKRQDWAAVPPLISKGLMIKNWSNNEFTFKENEIRFQGEPVARGIGRRMLDMAKKGDDPSYLMNFYASLQKNPSKRSVDQLFEFLNHSNIPIGKDGRVYAYKKVRQDYKDMHSGTFVNTPGSIMKMPRNKISDDPRDACAEGLHLGDLTYARDFGTGHMLICAVFPEHVVSVPYDASMRKMRVCEYEVIGHYGQPLPDSIIKPEELEVTPHANDLGEEDDDEDDDSVDVLGEIPEPAKKRTPVIVAQAQAVIDGSMESWTLDKCRDYAKTIGIKNVKGILGGKVALIDKIREVENVQLGGTGKLPLSTVGTVTGRTQTAVPNQFNTPKPLRDSAYDDLLAAGAKKMEEKAKLTKAPTVAAHPGHMLSLIHI